MKTPTIYDIKYLINQHTNSHFFDRGSMRFFGQTLKDFRVRKSPAGLIFIYAPMYRPPDYNERGPQFCGYTFREFIHNESWGSFDLETPAEDFSHPNSLQEIIDFIQSH